MIMENCFNDSDGEIPKYWVTNLH